MAKHRTHSGMRRIYDTGDHGVLAAECVHSGAEVVEARTEPECSNIPVVPVPVIGPVTVKVPVLLGELTVQINIDSVVRLPEPAIEIRRIGKKVYLDQCELLLPTNKLFLRGHVRKNIEYATASRVTRRSISGDIRHATVDVPFECVTPVTYATPPVEPTPEQYEEYHLLGGRLGRPLQERESVTVYNLDWKPYCELTRAVMIEADTERHTQDLKGTLSLEGTFRTFRSQMTLYLTVQVLQRQLVLDPAPAATPTPTPTPTPAV